MSERKVLNKYYPPDYDPSKVPRVKKKNKQHDVRIMAPFNFKCNTCGNYVANATKFNAKKETVEDETYNNLLIFRFYIKCPRCMAPIIFRTNPKEQGYEIEHGATENFMALKMAEKQARDEAEAEEEEEKINPMKHLENRTKASRQQMEASEQIQNLRSIKFRYHTVNLDSLIQNKRKEVLNEEEKSELKEEEDEIRAEAMRILRRKAIESSGESSSSTQSIPKIARTSSVVKSQPSKSGLSSLMHLKKKIKVIPRTNSSSIDESKKEHPVD